MNYRNTLFSYQPIGPCKWYKRWPSLDELFIADLCGKLKTSLLPLLFFSSSLHQMLQEQQKHAVPSRYRIGSQIVSQLH